VSLITTIGVPLSASFFHSSSQQCQSPKDSFGASLWDNPQIEMRFFILYNLQFEIINFLYKNLRKQGVSSHFSDCQSIEKIKNMKRMFIFLAILILVSCRQAGDSKQANRGANLESGMVTSQDTADVLKTYHQSLNIENDSINKIIWAQDARWLQAFGRVFKGRDTIISFTKYLNRSPGYAVSRVSRQDDAEITFIRPDVAVLHEHHEREGQIINGLITSTRKINTTYILSKENGVWKIRDKVTMDERERTN